jgi:hypothetical protein
MKVVDKAVILRVFITALPLAKALAEIQSLMKGFGSEFTVNFG